MNLVNQSAFLKALGWSLLDSLWQIGVLWLVYICLTANGKKYQSRQRHSLALLTLTGGSLWFLTTLVINFYTAAVAPNTLTLFVSDETSASSRLSLVQQVAGWFEPVLPFLSVGYLLAACFLFIRFYRQYRFTQRLFTQGLQKAHPEWRVFLQQAVAHMGIKKKVSIWFSSLVDTPLTLGFLKPVILLPIAAINHLSIKQAEAIILHELNHIRRNDYLVNLLIACVDIILFFNPFARLLTGIIRKERENSCDDMVLQFRYDAGQYAMALLTLEQNRLPINAALAVAATGKDNQLLLNRVKRILNKEQVTTSVNQKLVAYLISALLIGFIGWYNPGKVIIKKIDEVRVQPLPASVESGLTFSTPVAETGDREDADEPIVMHKAKDIAKEVKPQQKDPLQKLEALIEWTTDAKLAELTDKINQFSEPTATQVAGFVANSTYEVVDYALPKKAENSVPAPVLAAYPFVPSSSFSYQILEDTTLPKKYIMTYQEQKAKESVDKALVAIQAIDWKKLEKELNAAGGKEVNIAKLQLELKKAIQDIDLKKLAEKDDNADNAVVEELRNQQESFRIQLGNYQKTRVMQQQELKRAQNQVLLDRLEQHEQLKKMEEDKKKKTNCTTTQKVKKIVII